MRASWNVEFFGENTNIRGGTSKFLCAEIIDPKDRGEHKDRAKERVEEELVGRVNLVSPAPDTDDNKHRNEDCLEEEVEQHQIKSAEHPDHKRFQNKERHHVIQHTDLDGFLAGKNTERGQERCQQYKQNRDTVHAHAVTDTAAEPGRIFDKLELRR